MGDAGLELRWPEKSQKGEAQGRWHLALQRKMSEARPFSPSSAVTCHPQATHTLSAFERKAQFRVCSPRLV